MISPDVIAHYFKRNYYVLHMQVKGLSHEDSLLAPPFRANCLNWVLGHIVVYRGRALTLLGAEPVWDEDQATPYNRESEPLQAQDARPLEQIMADLDLSQERLDAALADLTAEDLERGVDESTMAERLTFDYWHEAYHTGQTELLRQLAGTDDKVI
ncbi:MAG: DinB family protein [Chloroflexota bacterium]|nr:MAG: DinB family protein [Chloroflexota bacterium]